MTDVDAYARCQCGHSRQKHRYGAHCGYVKRGPAVAAPWAPDSNYVYRPVIGACDCTRFEARPPVWRVEKVRRDNTFAEWFTRTLFSTPGDGDWMVLDPDPRNRTIAARCPTQAMAYRVAEALAMQRDDEVTAAMGRHPAGQMLEWGNPFRPMFPNEAQVVADARARLRQLPNAYTLSDIAAWRNRPTPAAGRPYLGVVHHTEQEQTAAILDNFKLDPNVISDTTYHYGESE